MQPRLVFAELMFATLNVLASLRTPDLLEIAEELQPLRKRKR